MVSSVAGASSSSSDDGNSGFTSTSTNFGSYPAGNDFQNSIPSYPGQYGAGFGYSPLPNAQNSFQNGFSPFGQPSFSGSQHFGLQQQPFGNSFPYFPSFQNSFPIQRQQTFPNAVPPYQTLNPPLPPILTPDEFNKAISQYLATIQEQYAR